MITLIAAIGKNNCIGKNGDIPWDIPADMKRLRKITLGKVLIMGRKTWESIPEHRRPLPGRTNVVLTSNESYPLPEGVERYNSIEDALEAHKDEEIIGFGGQRIFAEMMPMADTLDITHVDMEIDACDAFFPAINLDVWKETWREDHEGFSFVIYKRI
jgi:dihydrofolate reductase